jgi:hypothetical protein
MIEWLDLRTLLTALPSVGAATLFFKWRDYRRQRAAGSTVRVTDGVDHRRVRWARCKFKSWTGTPLRLKAVQIVWPLTARGYVWKSEQEARGVEIYDKSIDAPKGQRIIRLGPVVEIPSDKPLDVTVMIKTSERMQKSTRASRLYLRIIVETLDAQRRRDSLILRSEPVDWGKPPQE